MRVLPALVAACTVVGLLGPRGAPAQAEPSPATLPPGDAVRGEVLAGLAGCLLCHGPDGGGGTVAVPGVGSTYAPPLTHSALAGWTPANWLEAFRHGRSPEGEAYGPFFPWPAFSQMTDADLADIVAWTTTLTDVPAAPRTPPKGLWRLVGPAAASRMAAASSPALPEVEDEAFATQLARGRYLVSAVGHCGSCHDGRTRLGRPDPDARLGGGSRALAPNITTGNKALAALSIDALADALADGEDPEGEPFVDPDMAAISAHGLARLSDEDRRAIAAWLLAVPAVGAR
jgi:mono/diheme cytochrome c family protein